MQVHPEREVHYPSHPEIAIDPTIVEALKGRISEPLNTISHKPGSIGEMVTVRIAEEGPGMFFLSNWRDNKAWAGIFNHSVLSGRFAAHFSLALAKLGYDTNPTRIANTMAVVSHAGRRQWDEANWYPDIAPQAAEKKLISNETLGMRLIQGKVPQDVFDLTVALGHNTEAFSVDPAIFHSLDYLLAIYADHRTTQGYEPLHTRMGDFLLRNFYEKGTITPEIKEQVYTAIASVIDRQKRFRFAEEGAQEVSLDEADAVAEQLGAAANSPRVARREFMREILQDADTESMLILAGIDPDAVNEETVPIPEWEHSLRNRYIQAAEEEIITELTSRLFAMDQDMLSGGKNLQKMREELDKDFPPTTWWGAYTRNLWKQRTTIIS